MEKIVSRRRFIGWIGGSMAVGAAAMNAACAPSEPTRKPEPPQPTYIPRPIETATAIPLISEADFNTASPFERINRLENGAYPKDPSFNRRNALFEATIQAFCQQAGCSFADTAKNIQYGPENFIFPQEQSNLLYIVSEDGNSAIINTARLNSSIARLTSPAKGKDQGVLFEKTVLLSALAYLSLSREPLDYEPSSIRFPGPGQSVRSLGRIEGWVFVGKRENGSDFRLNGARLAASELLNHIVIAGKTEYQSSNAQILDAANLMSEINRRAEISDEEFVRYARGELRMGDFLDKWAAIKNFSNPSRKDAILALKSIALRANGFAAPNNTREGIRQWLGFTPIFTKPQGTPL